MADRKVNLDPRRDFAKPIQTIMQSSAPKVDSPQKPTMQPGTSAALPNSPTSVADKSLKRHLLRKSPIPLSEYVSLQRLADELGVELDRLKPLIANRYLRILSLKDDMATTVVARPSPEAMGWLRTMFMPLDMRPLIPVSEVVTTFGISEDELRYICVTDNLPIYNDPVFGELMSVTGFWALSKGLVAMRNPLRSDRQMLMMILSAIKNVKEPSRVTPLAYSERLEAEIRRIVKLPEPDRTLRATDFWKHFQDADTLTDLLEKQGSKSVLIKHEKLMKRADTLRMRMERQGQRPKPKEQSPGPPRRRGRPKNLIE